MTASPSNTVHVAAAANERYMAGLQTACLSVAAFSRPETCIVFHIFTEGVLPATFAEFTGRLSSLKPNASALRHECDESLLQGLPCWAGSRLASVRMLFPYLLPTVDYLIYIDSDVLCLGAIEEFWALRSPHAYATVVPNETVEGRRRQEAWLRNTCGCSLPDGSYFNSGVMLFNLQFCRENHAPEKLLDFLSTFPAARFPDQDALNYVFAGNVLIAPPKWNRLQSLLCDDKLNEHPMIHYVAGNPWLPKLGVTLSNRIRLWHYFNDTFIFHKNGHSVTLSYGHMLGWIKYMLYHVLKCPVAGDVLVGLLAIRYRNMYSWREAQVANDISFGSLAIMRRTWDDLERNRRGYR
jgi:lipopolysaccharide biosynthesis glycosyltransferase